MPISLISNHIRLTYLGFILFVPISILGFPVTVLVANPGTPIFELLFVGLTLTIISFLIYLPFIILQRTFPVQSHILRIVISLSAPLVVGFVRGVLFYKAVDYADLTLSSGLWNRAFASTTTTFICLTSANIVINYANKFRTEYRNALREYIDSQSPHLFGTSISQQSKRDVEELQRNILTTLSNYLNSNPDVHVTKLAEELKADINTQLRPISRRIWIRSIDQYPSFKFKLLIQDSIQELAFSKAAFMAIITFLAVVNNLFIRDPMETLVRTLSFLFLTLVVLKLERFLTQNSVLIFLLSLGLVPMILGETIANFLGYAGSWVATFMIIPVAPTLVIILSLLRLAARDQAKIVEILEKKKQFQRVQEIKYLHSDKHLASYLHNSYQSELLSLIGNLEDSIQSKDEQASLKNVEKLVDVVRRPILESFEEASESPLDRLEAVIASWSGLVDISFDVPKLLLNDQKRNSILVQTIEEFVSNSFRHGQATHISVQGNHGEKGLKLILTSNGGSANKRTSGFGTNWFEQIARSDWKLKISKSGTVLEIEI